MNTMPGLVGGEQQDRDGHDRDRGDGPGQFGERAEDVGERSASGRAGCR